MRLKRKSENQMSNKDIKEEVGTNTGDLEDFLENIGKTIEKTKDTVINEIIHITENEDEPETFKNENKPQRSLKKKSK